jgi:hypothetical protein
LGHHHRIWANNNLSTSEYSNQVPCTRPKPATFWIGIKSFMEDGPTWANHLDSLHPNKGEQLASKKLAEIWKNVLRLWHHQCDLQHKPDKHTPRLHQHQLHPRVHAIYAQKDKLDHIDKLILDQPIFTTLKLPSNQLKEWILTTESFVKRGLQRAKRQLQTRNHAINFFFLPQTNLAATTPTDTQTPTINSTACKNF